MRSTVGRGARRGCWRQSWWLAAVLAACFVVAAPAQAQPFVYVANGASNSVSQYEAIGGALSPLTPATVADPGSPFQVAVSPDGKSVYFTNNRGAPVDHVSQYNIGPTGALTPKTPAAVLTGQDPTGIAVTPVGKSVYVANFGGDTVSQYGVGPGGGLTPKTPATVAVPGGPIRVAVNPDGRSVYVTNVSNTVSQYDVGPGGGLTPKTPLTVAAGIDPVGVAVSPDGKSVYVSNNDFFAVAGTVSQYDVGPGGGLTPKTPPTVAAVHQPEGVAVSPDGKSVYVTNLGAGTVSQYDVGPGGALTPKTPATVGAAGGPYAIAVSPDGFSVYVANFGDSSVFQFSVGAGGRLTAKTPATVAAGLEPAGIAVTPLPRVPTSKEQCKNGGSRNFPQFKNQGDCVSFVSNDRSYVTMHRFDAPSGGGS
jgi:6-phosphogluconolactonase (cycloisomerase 2 family)